MPEDRQVHDLFLDLGPERPLKHGEDTKATETALRGKVLLRRRLPQQHLQGRPPRDKVSPLSKGGRATEKMGSCCQQSRPEKAVRALAAKVPRRCLLGALRGREEKGQGGRSSFCTIHLPNAPGKIIQHSLKFFCDVQPRKCVQEIPSAGIFRQHLHLFILPIS